MDVLDVPMDRFLHLACVDYISDADVKVWGIAPVQCELPAKYADYLGTGEDVVIRERDAEAVLFDD